MYKALMVSNLGFQVEDVPESGFPLVVAVRVALSANEVPQLCAPSPASSANSGLYGACSFYLNSGE